MNSKEVPLYKAIALELINEIRDGEITNDSKFPSERELILRYHVSRVTVRNALQLLEEEGYIHRQRGSRSQVVFNELVNTLSRSFNIRPFHDEISEEQATPSAIVLDLHTQKADKTIAKKLQIDIDSLVYSYQRLLLANDTPICYEHGYLPISLFPDFSMQVLKKSKFEYFENIHKLEIGYSIQEVNPLMPTAFLKKNLKLSTESPLLKVSHVTYTKSGHPIEIVDIIFDTTIYRATFIKFRHI